MTPLSEATLAEISARLGPGIAVPTYDRKALRAGIVHFGLGNFHRVHQAVYVDRCLRRGGAEGWGIVGVELIDNEGTRAKAAAYKAQDCLYTVTEYAPDGAASTRIIGAMIDYLHAPADPEAVLARLAHPDTKIVSLTITEGGYNLDESTGAFKLDTPEVAADLAGATTGKPPRTAFGYIVEALARRRAGGTAPFTVMSCDNLRHNGGTARKAIVSFATARDPDLGRWIDGAVAFPNSMVDRIAPQVPPEVKARLNTRSGIDDAVPALGETFMQWVIEDQFCDGRPELEEVGVELRDDVVAFEFMKGRMLNAGHGMLGFPALLCGYRIVHEAMGDRRLVRLLNDFLDQDVIPRLEGPKGISLPAYKDAVIERFSNPAINDQLLRIVLDGASKIPVFHTRTIEALLETNGNVEREAYLLACYAHYLKGRDDKGTAFPLVEPRLTQADWALVNGDDPLGVLKTSTLAGMKLWEHAEFAAAYRRHLDRIEAIGASKALDALLAG